MIDAQTAGDRPTTVKGLLPKVSRRALSARPRAAGRQLSASATQGGVLNFRNTGGWGSIGSTIWANGVSTDASTFEVWIRSTRKEPQTILIGSDGSGGLPIIAVADDQLSLYWSASGDAARWDSADTTVITDGQWHHVTVVLSAGSITFYKDGVATADSLSVDAPISAAGTLQLGAGFGWSGGFVGQIYDARVWSVARSAEQVANNRWASPPRQTPGLTALIGFEVGTQEIIDLIDLSISAPNNCNTINTDLPEPSCALLGAIGGVYFDQTGLTADSSALTFECWVRVDPADAANSMSLWCMLDVQLNKILKLLYAGNQQLSLTWGQEFVSADTTVIADGTWHHIAVVFDSNYVRIYKDGVATADQFQLAASAALANSIPAIAFGDEADGWLSGQMTDVRIWRTARPAGQIAAYRYTQMSAQDPDLLLLCNFADCDPSDPATMVPINYVAPANAGQMISAISVVAVDPPQQPFPQQVWTYQNTGISPIGPVQSTGAVLGVDAATVGSGLLRSIDPQTGVQNWEYDVRAQGGQNSVHFPAAMSATSDTVYLGVEVPNQDGVSAQVQAVNSSTGAPAWPNPATFDGFSYLLSRPTVMAGTVYVGLDVNGYGSLAWGSAKTGTLNVNYTFQKNHSYMTDPVIDQNNVYVGAHDPDGIAVTAIPLQSAGPRTPNWRIPLSTSITTEMVLGNGLLFVTTGGTISALNSTDGSLAWTHTLSTATVSARPVLLGSMLCIGSTDGVLYALNAATGVESWRLDTGSAITTDLINEDGVLYFANQGDGADVPPAFYAVDTTSQGADALSYWVPGADTILFAQGGTQNGNVYFYSSQIVYAVNMSNVVREFAINTKLVVENYDTTTITRSDGQPTGSDTSYRISMTVRDENGMARSNQSIKVWSADTLYITNQGTNPVVLSPTNQVWMQTDAAGDLTLAVSAYDTGTPATGSPNITCPALLLWGSFMSPQEQVVVFPDHESLTTLSNVQGAPPATGDAGNTTYLGSSTGYDGTPLISAAYSDPTSLEGVASTIRNTIGTRSPASVGATALAGHIGENRYVRTGVQPNVLYSADPASPTSRPYVPGADATFTMDLSGGTAVYQGGTYDPTPPASAGDSALVKWSDIGHFVDHVVKSTERVAKMAWTFTENAVTTVIHTAEAEYDLTITSLEDAVKVVTGFFKSVVDDLKKAIQFLSSLFHWKNILENHTYLKNAISNPDPNNPGMFQTLSSWLQSELAGGTDTTSVFAQLTGKGGTSVTAGAQTSAGQTVASNQAGGNNDPSTVYNTGGNNNANQCTWMSQKVNENSAGASVPPTLAGVADSDPLTALTTYFSQIKNALTGSFSQLPQQLNTQLSGTLDMVKDPHSFVSTGLSDILTLFTDIGDDLIDFAQTAARDTLQFLDSLLTSLMDWLTSTINIPFVSDLYKLISGDDLSLLDLLCLLGAVPGTILLDVITGSPTVPAPAAEGADDADPAGEKAGAVLLSVVGFVMGQLACALDIIMMDFKADTPEFYVNAGSDISDDPFLQKIDVALDLGTWLFNASASALISAYNNSSWKPQDYVFQAVQVLPTLINSAATVFGSGTSGVLQCTQDTAFAVLNLVMSSVFAELFPDSYKNAPKAPGLTLSANVFSSAQGISEILFVLLNPWDWILVQAPVKYVLFTVGNVLAFSANMLEIEHS